MKKFSVLLVGLIILVSLPTTGQAFQEYPSLEISPAVGYVLYDGQLASYMSNLTYGFRLDLRTTSLLGFQFCYSRSSSVDDLPGFPFGTKDYVERFQFNLTRDLLLVSGVFISGQAGFGSFNRHSVEFSDNDPSLQLGFSARRNMFAKLYLRTDMGWTGAFLDDAGDNPLFVDRTMTSNFDFSLSFSILLDN